MKFTGPIATLVAGAGLAAALLAANLNSSARLVAGAPIPPPGGAVGVAPTASATPPPAAPATPAPATSAPAADATAAGTGSATATPPPVLARATYAGQLPGGAALALAIRDGVAIAYLCDGRVEEWLQGTVRGATLELSGRGGARLTGTVDAARATGTVVAGGASSRFDIARATKPSGLYRSVAQLNGARVQGGWIVLPDGRQVGLLTVGGTGTRPAPPLDVSTGRVLIDGVAVTPTPIDGGSGSGF